MQGRCEGSCDKGLAGEEKAAAGTGLLLWPELGARFGLRFGPDLGLDLGLDLGCKNNKDGPRKKARIGPWVLKKMGPIKKLKTLQVITKIKWNYKSKPKII